MCVLQASLKEVLGKIETSDADSANAHLERILYIYHTLVEHSKGAKITKPQSVCEVCMCVFLYHLPYSDMTSFLVTALIMSVISFRFCN